MQWQPTCVAYDPDRCQHDKDTQRRYRHNHTYASWTAMSAVDRHWIVDVQRHISLHESQQANTNDATWLCLTRCEIIEQSRTMADWIRCWGSHANAYANSIETHATRCSYICLMQDMSKWCWDSNGNGFLNYFEKFINYAIRTSTAIDLRG